MRARVAAKALLLCGAAACQDPGGPRAGDRAAEPSRLEALVAMSERNRAGMSFEALIPSIPVGMEDRLRRELETEPQSFLFLNGLRDLDDRDAAAVGRFPGKTVVLPDLTFLPEDAATALAGFRGQRLFLDGLLRLSPGAARALARFGGELLSLGRARVDDQGAQALAGFGGVVALRLTPVPSRSSGRSVGPGPQTGAAREELRRVSHAVDVGDVAAIRAFLAGGGAPDFGEFGTTLLMEAAHHKQLEVARALVQAGADVNASNRDHRTPLMYALVYPLDVPGMSRVEVPRDPAVVLGLVRLLVEAGAEVSPTPPPAEQQDLFELPLVLAARLGHVAAIRTLLQHGARVTAKTASGRTALEAAIQEGHADAVDVLLDAATARDTADRGALDRALWIAVAAGANAATSFVYGATSRNLPVDGAELVRIRAGRIAIVRRLARAGADLHAVDDRGWSPLTHAINGGDEAVLAEVLRLGADPNRPGPDGELPLHFLAMLERLPEDDLVPLAGALVARGADRAARDRFGRTPAQRAEARGYRQLADRLRPE